MKMVTRDEMRKEIWNAMKIATGDKKYLENIGMKVSDYLSKEIEGLD